MTFAWWHPVVALLPMIPTFWSIWAIWNHDFITFQRKMAWLVFVILVPVIGGIIYIFVGRKQSMPRGSL
ncbi:MAG: PLDc_N domain-containing protein [Desulfovibrio sp.]|nr:PLDc_N domain-containing protein [Desulfovibrio sp.]